MRPADSEYPEYFRKYVSLVPEDDVLKALEPQVAIVGGLADRVEPSRETYAYGPGKWSVRELLGHVNDGERVFAYRALTFSRYDAVSLPGFDEVTWTHSPTGCPIIEGVGAWIDCTLEHQIELGDHYMVVGRVVDLAHHEDPHTPLVFFKGSLGRFDAAD